MAKKILETELSAKYTVDGAEFNEGIDNINKSLKKSKDIVNRYEREFLDAFDPDNVEPLEKALKELDGTLETNKKKTEALNEALQDVDEGTDEWIALRKQMEKTNRETVELTKKQDRLSSAINDINSGDLEKLPKYYQKAAENAGQAIQANDKYNESLRETKETSGGLTSELSNVGSDLIGGASIGAFDIGAIAGAGGPIAAAVAAVAGAIAVYSNVLERSGEISKGFAYNTNVTNLGGLQTDLRKTSKIFDQDYAESVETAKAQLKIFDTTVGESAQSNRDYITTMALMNNEYADIDRVISVVDQTQSRYNESLRSGVGFVNNMTQQIETYGSRMDDVFDTYNEFGSLFSGTDQFSRAVTVGADLGIRDTDQIGNAINELSIYSYENSDFMTAISEAEVSFEEALKNVGINYDEMMKGITDKTLSWADVAGQVLQGLAKIDDEAQRIATSYALFGGTPTEGLMPVLMDQEKLDAWSKQITNTSKELEKNKKAIQSMSDNLGLKDSTDVKTAKIDDKVLTENLAELGITEEKYKGLTKAINGSDEELVTFLEDNKILSNKLKNNSEALQENVEALKDNKLEQLLIKESTDETTASNLALTSILGTGTIAAGEYASSLSMLGDELDLTELQEMALKDAMDEGLQATLEFINSIGKTDELVNFLYNSGLITDEMYEQIENTGLLTTNYEGLNEAIAGGTDTFLAFLQESGAGTDALLTAAEQVGLTTEQVSQLSSALNIGNGSAYDYLVSINQLGPVLANVGEKMGLNTDQANSLEPALTALRDGNTQMATAILDNSGALEKFNEIGIISTSLYDDMTESTDLVRNAYDSLNQTVDENITKSDKYAQTALKSMEITNPLVGGIVNLSGANEKASSSTQALATKYGLSSKEADKLKKQLIILTDETKSTDKRTQAFEKSLDILSTKALPRTREQALQVQEAWMEMSGQVDVTNDSYGTLEERLTAVSDNATDSYGDIANLQTAYTEGLNPLEAYRVETGLLADNLERVSAADGKMPGDHWWNNDTPFVEDIFGSDEKSQTKMSSPTANYDNFRSMGTSLHVGTINLKSNASNVNSLIDDINLKLGYLSQTN